MNDSKSDETTGNSDGILPVTDSNCVYADNDKEPLNLLLFLEKQKELSNKIRMLP